MLHFELEFTNCHFPACSASGDVFTFYARKHDLNGDFPAVLRGIAADFGIANNGAKPDKPRKLVKRYAYHGPDGTDLFYKNRFEPKDFSLCRPNGEGGFISSMGGVEPVLYNLPALIEADEVWIVEGEKDADNLNGIGFTATTNFDGAGKWRESYTEALRGKTVFILPDNDDEGRKHAQKVARELQGKAKSIRLIELPGLPPKGDFSDFLAGQPDTDTAAERLAIMAEGAAEWTPVDDEKKQDIIKIPLAVNVSEDWLGKEPPALDPIFEDFFDINHKIAIIGGTKRKKSFIAAIMATLSASGREAIGLKASKPRKTLLVQFEITMPYMWRRIKALCKAEKISAKDIDGRLFVLNMRDVLDDENFEVAALNMIDSEMERTGAELLVVDPIYVLLEGEENETRAMRKLLRRLGTICRDRKAGMAYAQHDKKSGHFDSELSNRGSGTGLTARDYDGALFLSPHESDDDNLTVVEYLVRYRPPKEPYTIRWEWGKENGEEWHHFVLSDEAAVKKTKSGKKTDRDLSKYVEKARSILSDYTQRTKEQEMPIIDFKAEMKAATGLSREKICDFVSLNSGDGRDFSTKTVYPGGKQGGIHKTIWAKLIKPKKV